jgi:hypothetical protein
MSKYIDAEKLKAEIERRISNLRKIGNDLFIQTYFREQWQLIHGYESILPFLDTLEAEEKEQRSAEIGLALRSASDEILLAELERRGLQKDVDLEKEIVAAWNNWKGGPEDFGYIMRHFYELGCRRTAVMYDDIEYERQRAEEAGNEEFEKELRQYWLEQKQKGVIVDGSIDDYITVQEVARHFAEWGRKQVLQEIYDGKVKPVDKITAAWLDDE